MGEVFSAVDTRLDRAVALKILPPDFAADGDRLRRFQAEAKTLASLSHPNILSIFEVGSENGNPYLVSELLEGRTLREELIGGPLPVRKAVDYALQIAQGLAAAHARGIIHRDLKPENIFITKDGRVKILDFGLAKLNEVGRGSGRAKSQVAPNAGSAGASPHQVREDAVPTGSAGSLNKREMSRSRGMASPDHRGGDSPTLFQSTVPGVILGTPAYMSPEQVRGETADHRSDIFAFGCVLYEMLSGNRAFQRETSVASMNAILSETPPDQPFLNAQTPPALERVIFRCLEKAPTDRFQSARDLAFGIEVSSSSSRIGALAPVSPRLSPLAKYLAPACALIIAAFLGGFLIARTRQPAQSAVTSIRYLTYSGRDYSPSVSPDGSRVCFSSDRGDGIKRIWIKELGSGNENWITAGPDDSPRFSPDGTSILFTRSSGSVNSLHRIPAIGGEPFKMMHDAQFGDWSPDGRRIAFVRWPAEGGSLLGISGIDGSAETILHRLPEARCSAPRWSRDGGSIAISVNDRGLPQSLLLVDVAAREARHIRAAHPYNLLSSTVWDRTGKNLIWSQAESSSANSVGSTSMLFRQSVRSGRSEKLMWSAVHARTVDILPSGNLVLDSRSSRENLKEFALGGGSFEPRTLTLGNSTDRQPCYSPDGEQIVFSSNRGGNLDIWSISRKTGVARRLTDHPADDWDPGFSPDGKHLIWSSDRSGNLEIWIANADGSSPRQVTRDGFAAENPTMTSDGRWIIYSANSPKSAGIWKTRPDGTGAVQLVPGGTLGNPEVSPDGKYVAFLDNRGFSSTTIRFVSVETGDPVPFEISVPTVKETTVFLGRCRWMVPEGKSIVFVGQNQEGVAGLFIQEFSPGQDTSATRKPLASFDRENYVESFGIAPDGKAVAIAAWEQFYSLMITEGLN